MLCVVVQALLGDKCSVGGIHSSSENLSAMAALHLRERAAVEPLRLHAQRSAFEPQTVLSGSAATDAERQLMPLSQQDSVGGVQQGAACPVQLPPLCKAEPEEAPQPRTSQRQLAGKEVECVGAQTRSTRWPTIRPRPLIEYIHRCSRHFNRPMEFSWCLAPQLPSLYDCEGTATRFLFSVKSLNLQHELRHLQIRKPAGMPGSHGL